MTLLFADWEDILDGALQGGLQGAIVGAIVGLLAGVGLWVYQKVRKRSSSKDDLSELSEKHESK